MSLTDRIDAALAANGRMSFYDLANEVFPRDQYPRAWRHAIHGGPPGCYMALSMALRRGDYAVTIRGPGPGNRHVYPRSRAASIPSRDE